MRKQYNGSKTYFEVIRFSSSFIFMCFFELALVYLVAYARAAVVFFSSSSSYSSFLFYLLFDRVMVNFSATGLDKFQK